LLAITSERKIPGWWGIDGAHIATTSGDLPHMWNPTKTEL